jgi:glutamyl-tRNA reductase
MSGPADGSLLVLGLSHRTAHLEAREQAALSDHRARRVLRELASEASVSEAAVLSTCNRTEIYAVARTVDGEPAIRQTLLRHTAVGASTLACASYLLRGDDAVEHLFRVTAGLESAILGESEIAGQVRGAAARSAAEGLLGPDLKITFDHALAAAARVRRRTGIGVGATSLASAVAELVEASKSGGQGRTVLVGAGRMGQAIAGALAGRRDGELVVLNRTFATAEEVAARFAARAGSLEHLEEELRIADTLVCATDAPHPVVQAAVVEGTMRARRAPLLVVDLAVPRDVEPAAAAVRGVTVHDIDAVGLLVRRNLEARRSQVDQAGGLIRDEVAHLASRRSELDAMPVVRAAWRRAERLRQNELARACAGLSAEERTRLETVTAGLVRKLLHDPCERVRFASSTPDGPGHLASFRMLFGLDVEESEPAHIRRRPHLEALRDVA